MTTPATSERMRRTKGRDNPLEMALRSALHARGLRFRVHHPVPGRARRTIDVAFPRRRLAIFVDGCFWHACPIHGSVPRSNVAFWETKLDRNRTRDADTDDRLRSAGWWVLRLWEHESLDEMVLRVESALAARTGSREAPQGV